MDVSVVKALVYLEIRCQMYPFHKAIEYDLMETRLLFVVDRVAL